MEISSVCVQCTELKVCFTHFGSVDGIVDCVSSLLEVGRGVSDDRKTSLTVQLMFHEKYLDLMIPQYYQFSLDMNLSFVKEYIRIQLTNANLF